jgi:hypothetical protein
VREPWCEGGKRTSKSVRRKEDNDTLPYVAFTSEFEVQR